MTNIGRSKALYPHRSCIAILNLLHAAPARGEKAVAGYVFQFIIQIYVGSSFITVGFELLTSTVAFFYMICSHAYLAKVVIAFLMCVLAAEHKPYRALK